MKRFMLVCVGLSLLVAVNGAQASWTQSFNESGVGNFDLVAVQMVSAGDYFESPTHQNLPAGWLIGIEDSSVSPTLASAYGPSTTNMTWNIVFAGNNTNPLVFDFVAFDGTTIKESIQAQWIGAAWSFSNSQWAPERSDLLPAAVPVPGAFLLSGIGMSLAGWLRKRRTL